jgi:hypothetical protein
MGMVGLSPSGFALALEHVCPSGYLTSRRNHNSSIYTHFPVCQNVLEENVSLQRIVDKLSEFYS